MKFILSKYTIQRFLKYSQSYATITALIPEHFRQPKKKPCTHWQPKTFFWKERVLLQGSRSGGTKEEWVQREYWLNAPMERWAQSIDSLAWASRPALWTSLWVTHAHLYWQWYPDSAQIGLIIEGKGRMKEGTMPASEGACHFLDSK